MTTVHHLRDVVASPASTVSIAGVPWPTFKVVALLVGLLVFAVVAVATASAAPAVLTGAGVAAAIWIASSLAASGGR